MKPLNKNLVRIAVMTLYEGYIFILAENINHTNWKPEKYAHPAV